MARAWLRWAGFDWDRVGLWALQSNQVGSREVPTFWRPGPHSIPLLRSYNTGLSPTKGQEPVLNLGPGIALAPTDLKGGQCLFFSFDVLSSESDKLFSRVWKMGQGEGGGGGGDDGLVTLKITHVISGA